MIGLELTFKGKTIAASVEQGAASIIVTQLRNASTDSIQLDFSGLQKSVEGPDEYPRWLEATNLQEGDELIVRVKRIDDISNTNV